MGREIHRLGALAIGNAKRPGYFCDGGGLYLQVSSALTKSWIFRYSRQGKAREMGLGSVRDVSLARARARASDARTLLADGLDPIEARADQTATARLQAAGTISFAECAKKYIAAHCAGWKSAKHAEQWQNTLDTYAGPVIGRISVRDVDTGLVLQVLEPIWAKKSETASRLRGRIERVLDYGKVRGWRVGENPARWRGHLDKLLAASLNRKGRQHHPALPYSELPAFIVDLRAQEGEAARALEFLILNASRTREVRLCEPKEIDFLKAVWTAPSEHMKAGREHRAPLCARALELAKERPGRKYVFAGGVEGEPLSDMAMLEVLRRMGRPDITVHGFRSTFRDWAAECTTYPNEVCEMALAHAIGDKVEAAYRRGDLFEKRRRLMADWARYCDPAAADTVAPIRKAAVA